jgi:uncharacterized membrane protein YfcA
MSDPVLTFMMLCIASFVAGVMNSVAGGGTLLTFPALLSVVSPVVANASSTVALVPSSLAGAWGYRSEVRDSKRWLAILFLPSLLGGIVGSLLVTRLPEGFFSASVPWLILTAATLFLIQPYVAVWTGIGRPHAPPSGGLVAAVAFFQFLVAIYGGYFGAGIGILMLSSLSLMGMADIHQMNALKTVLAAVINGVSVVIFVVEGKVEWRYALVMSVAASLGGYCGARLARRLNRTLVRWIVIAIGFSLGGYYLWKQMHTGSIT